MDESWEEAKARKLAEVATLIRNTWEAIRDLIEPIREAVRLIVEAVAAFFDRRALWRRGQGPRGLVAMRMDRAGYSKMAIAKRCGVKHRTVTLWRKAWVGYAIGGAE